MKVLFSTLAIIFITSLNGQGVIDSLMNLYPGQTGKEKVVTLGELCYQLASDDSKAALQFGKMGYEEALETNDKALIAQSLNDWSIAYLIEGNFDSVIVLSKECITLREAIGDSVGVAKSLNKLANAQQEMGQEEVSLQNNLRAIEIFNSNNLKQYSGRIYTNIAALYEGRGLYELALEYYRKAKAIAKEDGNMDAYFVAQANEGTCFTKLGNYVKAEELLEEALTYYLKNENLNLIGSIYQGIGFNATVSGDLLKAFNYYSLALEQFELNGSLAGMSLNNINLGQNLMNRKDFVVAEVYLKKGLELSIQSQSILQLQHAYKALTRLENLKGNYEAADAYFDLYEAYKDSTYNAETSLAIADMQVKYDTEQKVKDLENEKLKSKNTQLWLLISIAVIVLLGLFILFLNYRKKLQSEKLKVDGYKNVEKERTRIARDLHDNLGAELSLISSKIDIEIFKANNEAFKTNLETISNVSKNANHQLRETIWSIHKTDISVNDLKEKIESFAFRVTEGTNINNYISCSNPTFKFTPALALNLFRIAQEAINNSIKYGDIKAIKVQLSPNKLQIIDDGSGFNVSDVRRGYGLNNIEERSKDIGGDLTLDSTEKGTTINIQF
ncbi:MAG: tetratricopeptide repeat protein [Crocinitomicaceae bacterium]